MTLKRKNKKDLMASLHGEGAQDPSLGHGGRRNVI